jgi:hypothetical protein
MRSLAKAVVPLAALAGAASAACPAVRCLGIPAGCQTAPVSYTKGGSADEFSFGSPTTGEWFLDVDDQTVTDHMEDPRAGDGTCPSDFETAGVDCACSHTRAELERHDRDASGGQDLLVQLEAAAGFTFSSRVRRHSLFSLCCSVIYRRRVSSRDEPLMAVLCARRPQENGGLCFTTDRDAVGGGWVDDPDCPGGGIGYAQTCPPSVLQIEGECGWSVAIKAAFIFFVAVMICVLAKVMCGKKAAGPTGVAQAHQPRHMRAAEP